MSNIRELKKENLTMLPIEQLEPSEFNTYAIEDLDELIGSIKSCGLLTPLSVIGPTKEGMYEILSGERRFTAIDTINKENENFKFVPCYIVGSADMDPLEQKLIIETANVETRDFDKNERVFSIIRILKDMKSDDKYKASNIIKELEQYVGMSERYRRAYVTIFDNGGDDLIEAVSKSNTRVMDAARLALLDEDEKAEATKRLNEGDSAKNIINDFKNKKALDEAQKQAERETFLLEDDVDNISLDDVLGLIDDAGISTDGLSIDTTKSLKGLSKSDKETGNNTLETVVKWCKKMMSKTSYTPEESEALVSVLNLAEYINTYVDLQSA